MFLEYHTDMVPRYGQGKPPHRELYEIIDAHRGGYETILNQSLRYIPRLQEIERKGSESSSNEIVWNNGYLPGLDIAMIYTMLAIKKPNKYIEVGSGYSTFIAHKVISEQKLNTRIISIDPKPRAEIDGITVK